MKKILYKSIKLLAVFSGCIFFLTSCEYEEIRDADYPDPVVYMPAAARGMFVINNVPSRPDVHPTPGFAYRFLVDNGNNKFVVPLSVYRSGFEHSNSVDIEIQANTDTIVELIALEEVEGGLPDNTGVLSSERYSLPSSVTVPKGTELGTFELEVDLNYLLASPDTVFALGVSISSSQIEVNPLLNTTVILIHTRILYPIAGFSFNILTQTQDTAQVNFVNSSVYAMRYLWDFGDGRTDTIRNPVHYYTASGTYNVSLTAIGVVGATTQDVETATIEIQLQ